VKDTNETSEESVPVPMYCEEVKAVETLQQFLQSVSDAPESEMKSVWERYIYHRTGSETYERRPWTHISRSNEQILKSSDNIHTSMLLITAV
jgi:sarcosine oxidase delta subunit